MASQNTIIIQNLKRLLGEETFSLASVKLSSIDYRFLVNDAAKTVTNLFSGAYQTSLELLTHLRKFIREQPAEIPTLGATKIEGEYVILWSKEFLETVAQTMNPIAAYMLSCAVVWGKVLPNLYRKQHPTLPLPKYLGMLEGFATSEDTQQYILTQLTQNTNNDATVSEFLASIIKVLTELNSPSEDWIPADLRKDLLDLSTCFGMFHPDIEKVYEGIFNRINQHLAETQPTVSFGSFVNDMVRFTNTLIERGDAINLRDYRFLVGSFLLHEYEHIARQHIEWLRSEYVKRMIQIAAEHMLRKAATTPWEGALKKPDGSVVKIKIDATTPIHEVERQIRTLLQNFPEIYRMFHTSMNCALDCSINSYILMWLSSGYSECRSGIGALYYIALAVIPPNVGAKTEDNVYVFIDAYARRFADAIYGIQQQELDEGGMIGDGVEDTGSIDTQRRRAQRNIRIDEERQRHSTGEVSAEPTPEEQKEKQEEETGKGKGKKEEPEEKPERKERGEPMDGETEEEGERKEHEPGPTRERYGRPPKGREHKTEEEKRKEQDEIRRRLDEIRRKLEEEMVKGSADTLRQPQASISREVYSSILENLGIQIPKEKIEIPPLIRDWIEALKTQLDMFVQSIPKAQSGGGRTEEGKLRSRKLIGSEGSRVIEPERVGERYAVILLAVDTSGSLSSIYANVVVELLAMLRRFAGDAIFAGGKWQIGDVPLNTFVITTGISTAVELGLIHHKMNPDKEWVDSVGGAIASLASFGGTDILSELGLPLMLKLFYTPEWGEHALQALRSVIGARLEEKELSELKERLKGLETELNGFTNAALRKGQRRIGLFICIATDGYTDGLYTEHEVTGKLLEHLREFAWKTGGKYNPVWIIFVLYPNNPEQLGEMYDNFMNVARRKAEELRATKLPEFGHAHITGMERFVKQEGYNIDGVSVNFMFVLAHRVAVDKRDAEQLIMIEQEMQRARRAEDTTIQPPVVVSTETKPEEQLTPPEESEEEITTEEERAEKLTPEETVSEQKEPSTQQQTTGAPDEEKSDEEKKELLKAFYDALLIGLRGGS